MGREQDSAAAKVERLTQLRDAAEKGSSEHREPNHRLIKARRRLLDVEWGERDRRRAPVSRSLAALRISAAAVHESGAEIRIFEVSRLDLPPYAPGVEAPDRARKFTEAVYAADGLLWSSPIYHGTISGSFKNALDWLELLGRREPPYLKDKAVGLISTARGVQGLQAVNTMEFVVRSLRGWAVPLVIPIAGRQAFDSDGRNLDARVEAQLRSLGHEVAEVCFKRRPDLTAS